MPLAAITAPSLSFFPLPYTHSNTHKYTHTHTATYQAKLRVVPWDGYLKYYNLGDKHPGLIEKRRKVIGCHRH